MMRHTVLATLLLLCCACDPAPVILHTGDSITVFSTASLQQIETRAGLLAVNEGRSGYGLKDLIYWELRHDAIFAVLRPDVVIVTLGSNDIKTPAELGLEVDPLDDYAERIDRYMASLPDVPVYWFGVPETWAESTPARAKRAARVSAEMLDAQARWPNLKLRDPAIFLGCDGCMSDIVHPSPKGARTLAKWAVSVALDDVPADVAAGGN